MEPYVPGGIRFTRQYNIWQAMLQRCYNPKAGYYELYGGRGITVCDEWHNSKNFYEWAVNNGYADNLTLDRIDGNRGYCPDNCRWVDMKTQSNNTSKNIRITVNGETKTLMQWSECTGLKYTKLWYMNKTKKNVETFISQHLKTG